MGLSLKDLETAMAPLASVGKGELDFDVLGTRIWLRGLTPDEEIDVQRSARASIVDGGDLTDQVGALEYLDRFRKASLGYSIVQIGDLDFRNEEFIETGEVLQNGQKVKQRRHEVLQNLVGKWSRPMQVAVYTKFGELMDSIEKEAEGLIEVNPVDHDAEIARLEERIRELKDEKGRTAASNADSRTANRRQVAAVKKTRIRPTTTAAPAEDDQRTTTLEAETVVIPSEVEREIEEESGSEEEPGESEEQQAAREKLYDDLERLAEIETANEEESAPEPPAGPRKPVFARATGPVPPPPPGVPTAPTASGTSEPTLPKGPASSFVDSNDPDAMEAAVLEENKRVMEMRQSRGRIPPHLAAKTVEKEIAAQPKPVLSGMRDGKEVYKMPEQVMTDRGKTPAAPASPPVVTNPPSKNVNPRFKPISRK